MQPAKYRTITAPATGDFRDRGSKFLSFAYPILTVDDIKEKISKLKKEHPKATHHCIAWRLGTDGQQFRASDDGEPAGSAGKPILGQIDSLELTNVLVVVVRYFGGSLLGVPGLINAYRTATQLALDACTMVTKWVESPYSIRCNYPQIGEVLYLLKQSEATLYRQQMQLFCDLQVGIPTLFEKALVAKLIAIRGVELTRM